LPNQVLRPRDEFVTKVAANEEEASKLNDKSIVAVLMM